ncbi:hypothetical protein WDC_0861 [Paucilactobacillus wasatchensis]|uniref:Uncharacterized protein n=1 Tax=Paucilactobacillus wasatchensis TaxID=1335616 RepID=A0A0D0YWE1_9LACO|nr:hypothetical protein WDC_0861 [Paucilactobacillus wasatchensis]
MAIDKLIFNLLIAITCLALDICGCSHVYATKKATNHD